jgi:hypothetical protein
MQSVDRGVPAATGSAGWEAVSEANPGRGAIVPAFGGENRSTQSGVLDMVGGLRRLPAFAVILIMMSACRHGGQHTPSPTSTSGPSTRAVTTAPPRAPTTTTPPRAQTTTTPPRAPISAGPDHSAYVAVPGGDEMTTWGSPSAPSTVTVWKWVPGNSAWRRQASVNLTVPAGVGFHPSIEGGDVTDAPDAIFVVHADFGSANQQAELIGHVTSSWGQLVSDAVSPAMRELIAGTSAGDGAYLDAGFAAHDHHELVTVTANPFFTGEDSRSFPLIESWKRSALSLRRDTTTAVTATAARKPGVPKQALPFGACSNGAGVGGGFWTVPGGLGLTPVVSRAALAEGAYMMSYPEIGPGATCSQRLDDTFPTVVRVIGGGGWIVVPLWVSVWVNQQQPVGNGLDVPVPQLVRSAASPFRVPAALGVTAFVQSDGGGQWAVHTAMSGSFEDLVRY